MKVRADHDGVRERLAAIGAERTASVRQVDTYYDAPHRDFAETDEALRLRRETVADDSAADGAGVSDDGRTPETGDPETRVTYKGPLVEAASKTREEFETAVADAAATEGILGGLGFEAAATVEKRRDLHSVGDYTVTLDSVSGLGEFVEVEREATESAVEAARAGAYDVLADLGLDPADQIRTSYLGLLIAADADDEERNAQR